MHRAEESQYNLFLSQEGGFSTYTSPRNLLAMFVALWKSRETYFARAPPVPIMRPVPMAPPMAVIIVIRVSAVVFFCLSDMVCTRTDHGDVTRFEGTLKFDMMLFGDDTFFGSLDIVGHFMLDRQLRGEALLCVPHAVVCSVGWKLGLR